MILLTGASGLLGSNFLLTAIEKQWPCVGVYQGNPVSTPHAECVRADLSNADEAMDVVARFKPKWIVHTAALANVDTCEENPDLARKANVEMPLYLAQAARKQGARMVYISTDSVFDGTRSFYREDEKPSPLNVYAQSKLEGEHAVLGELPSSIIARTNIFGWGLYGGSKLAEWILQKLEKGERVPGFKDVIFNPILVNDLSVVLHEMMQKDLQGLYHVVGSEALSKHEFAVRIARTFGLDETLVDTASVNVSNLKAKRPNSLTLNTDKIARDLGHPMPDINSGLQRFKQLRDSGSLKKLRAFKGESHASN